ncbi:MAG: HTTM domain-containing protein [Flavobacteriaceae bacterium]
MLLKKIQIYFESSTTDSSKLAVFRIFFGLLMFFSMIRFWSKGWIQTLYIEPKIHFKYFNFEWIQSLGNFNYLLFAICSISALLVAIGFKYRVSILVFFVSFTYIELIDKTTYLNHYYFVSIVSFLMCFLPAHHFFSVDSFRSQTIRKEIPKWSVDSIKLLLSIVYIYAGLAKINSDWLLHALPLAIWLPSKYDLPLIGNSFLQFKWVHHLMSWGGMLYDLLIPFLLIIRKTRGIAFLFVVFFHVLTRILFPIGMFPYIMIFSALIFFDASFHNKILNFFSQVLNALIGVDPLKTSVLSVPIKKGPLQMVSKYVLILFFVVQLLFPFRYLLYPGELFWNEQGYRFSWRVMLMEKKGYTNFKIMDSVTKKSFYVDNSDFLTPFQEKQMSFQPDFILEYAHYLGDHFKNQGHQNTQVFAESYVGLNGRPSRQFIDPDVDLYKEKESFKHKTWIVPLEDEIKGF